jgi:hypothetical protein
LTGELLEADDSVLDVLAAGYDKWLSLFEAGICTMRERDDLSPEADPRHLAIALVSAHQGGAMVTHVTNSADPFRTAVDAAVGYVSSFARTSSGRAVLPSSRSRRAAAPADR